MNFPKWLSDARKNLRKTEDGDRPETSPLSDNVTMSVTIASTNPKAEVMNTAGCVYGPVGNKNFIYEGTTNPKAEVMNTAGCVYGPVGNTNFIYEDKEGPLKDNLWNLESKLRVEERKLCDKKKAVVTVESKIKNLEETLEHFPQVCDKADDTQNIPHQICRLKEDVESHKDEIEKLENTRLPKLMAEIEKVKDQLKRHEDDAQEKIDAIPDLEEKLKSLIKDLEKYHDDIASERDKVAELSRLIKRIQTDFENQKTDQRKRQETIVAEIKKLREEDLKEIKIEQAKLVQELQDERRARKASESLTQKLQHDLGEMKANQIKQEKQEKQLKVSEDLQAEREETETDVSTAPHVRVSGDLQAEREETETDVSSAQHVRVSGDLQAEREETETDVSTAQHVRVSGDLQAEREETETDVSTAQHVRVAATPPGGNGTDQTLFEACRKGDLNLVKRIQSEGKAEVNCRDCKGQWRQTLVMDAAFYGQREVVAFLVSKGADVSLVDNAGDNILHWACRGGDVETVKFVLAQNMADIDSMGKRRTSPVMEAAQNGRRAVVEFLVHKRADVSLVDKDGCNILHLACQGGDVEVVKFILSLNGLLINSRGNASITPLLIAAQNGHRAVVAFLVRKGADVSLVDAFNDNILHWACWSGDVEIVKFVLAQNIAVINASIKKVANEARLRGQRELVDLLLSYMYGRSVKWV